MMGGIPLSQEQRRNPATNERKRTDERPLTGVALAENLRRAEQCCGNSLTNHTRVLDEFNEVTLNRHDLYVLTAQDPVVRSFMPPLPENVREAGKSQDGGDYNRWWAGVNATVDKLMGDVPYPDSLREFRTLIIERGMAQKITVWQVQAEEGHVASDEFLKTARIALLAHLMSVTSADNDEVAPDAHIGYVSEFVISTMVRAQIDPDDLIDRINAMSSDERDAYMNMLGRLSRQFSGTANVTDWEVATDLPLVSSGNYVETNLPYIIAQVEKNLKAQRRKELQALAGAMPTALIQ